MNNEKKGMTPGEIALTGRVSLDNTCGIYVKICLVTSISLITFGPNASEHQEVLRGLVVLFSLQIQELRQVQE